MAPHQCGPSFGSRIEEDTRALAMPEGRRVGQPGHDRARRYLLKRLTGLELLPFRGDAYELPFIRTDPWTGRQLRFTNLAGVIPGKDRSLEPALIGAHYDSVIDAPCADDNATAVGAVLAAAECFIRKPPRRDVVVALFDSEEPPYFHTAAMGSTRFYEDHCRGKVRFACAVILDLIGHDVELPIDPGLSSLVPGIREMLFVLGAESHPALPGVVEGASPHGLRIVPTLNRYIGDMSDHHAFRLGGEPFLFLSCGWGRYYHSEQDDLSWVNFKKVERVAKYVVELVRGLGDASIHGPAPESDPAAFEIRMIKKALGIKYPIFRRVLGLPPLESRADLSALINALTGIDLA